MIGTVSFLETKNQKWKKQEQEGVIAMRTTREKGIIILNEMGEVWQGVINSDEMEAKYEKTPLKFGDFPIISISAGVNHFITLDEDGEVWVWTDGSGNGNDSGQLGQGNTNNITTPTLIPPQDFDQKKVKVIEGGYLQTYVLTEDGTLYGCGYNNYSNVKPGESNNQTKMNLITNEVDELFPLGTSSYHIFFKKKGGEIGFLGRNDEGQVGNGTTEHVREIQILNSIKSGPEEIDLSDIKNIFTFLWATFILTTKGEVFTSGRQFSCGFPEKKLNFFQMDFPERVIDICGGGYHNLFLSESGKVWITLDNSQARIPDSILKEKAFDEVFLLPELQIPEIKDLNLQTYSDQDIPFKLHSGWHLDIAILPNLNFQELVEEDLNDFEF